MTRTPHVRDRKTPTGRFLQSLADAAPPIAALWRPDGNGTATPETVGASCNSRADFSCSTCPDNIVDRVVAELVRAWRRTQQAPRCRPCAKSLLKAGCSLAEVDPQLAAKLEPDPDRPYLNGTTISYGSKSRYRWLCPHHADHQSWSATIPTCRRHGCPTCGSLAFLHPRVAAQWDVQANGRPPGLTAANARNRVWWRCGRNHTWRAQVRTRVVQRTGCPTCASTHSSAEQIRLYAELVTVLGPLLDVTASGPNRQLPELAALRRGRRRYGPVDLVLVPAGGSGPRGVVVEHDVAFWHDRRLAADRDKSAAIRGCGYALVRTRQTPLPLTGPDDVPFDRQVRSDASVQALAADVLDRIAERGWLDAAVAQLAAGYRARAVLVGDELARSMLADVDLPDVGVASMAHTYPDLVGRYDVDANGGITPRHFTSGSDRVYLWRCDQGHLFPQSPAAIRSGRGCGFCAGKRVDATNAVATTHSELLADWPDDAPYAPTEVTAGSHMKILWRCHRCGHRWPTQVRDRTRKRYPSRCRGCHPDAPGKAPGDR